jgi:LacI family transcriptional regulator
MQTLLLREVKVDGVFAVNDPSAIGAMKAIWDHGLRVPDDIAVVGAGDVAYSDLIRVPLTTVRWSKRDLGRTAAELILDQMGSTRTVRARRVIIPPELVVRSSS